MNESDDGAMNAIIACILAIPAVCLIAVIWWNCTK